MHRRHTEVQPYLKYGCDLKGPVEIKSLFKPNQIFIFLCNITWGNWQTIFNYIYEHDSKNRQVLGNFIVEAETGAVVQ